MLPSGGKGRKGTKKQAQRVRGKVNRTQIRERERERLENVCKEGRKVRRKIRERM